MKSGSLQSNREEKLIALRQKDYNMGVGEVLWCGGHGCVNVSAVCL